MKTQKLHIWGQNGSNEPRLLTSALIGDAERIASRNYFEVDRMWITTSKKSPTANPDTVQQAFTYVRQPYTVEIVREAGAGPLGGEWMPEVRETVTVEAWTPMDAHMRASAKMKMRVMGQMLRFYHNGVQI